MPPGDDCEIVKRRLMNHSWGGFWSIPVELKDENGNIIVKSCHIAAKEGDRIGDKTLINTAEKWALKFIGTVQRVFMGSSFIVKSVGVNPSHTWTWLNKID